MSPDLSNSAYDLVVVGSGAAGLTAALAAAMQGRKVAVLEKDRWAGGTSAISGGWLWIPGNDLAVAEGIVDPVAGVKTYLREELGDFYDDNQTSAFLRYGPEMVRFLTREGHVRFESGSFFPDYHPRVPGASQGGRAIRAKETTVRDLGDAADLVRPLLNELTFIGLGIGSGSDMKHFTRATRSMVSAWFVLRRIGRYAWDRLTIGRSHVLVNGNALIGQLLKACLARDVKLLTGCEAHDLHFAQGRAVAVAARQGAREMRISARLGIVLASGGFGHAESERLKYLPHVRQGGLHFSLSPKTVSGDGLRMAVAAGAALEESASSPALYAPVSLVRRSDGTVGLYPHFADRGKPGVIAVRADGRRFVNESNSYHDVIRGLLTAPPLGDPAPFAFFVCDARAIRRYGLGIAKPFPVPLLQHIRSGYLKTGRTLRELAASAGIDAVALEETVRRFNLNASQGEDPEFGKGGNRYNHFQGDLDHRPNPCLAPIEEAPFYAVKFFPGDLGTSVGIRVNGHSQVIDSDGRTVPGLYAAGNDTTGPMRGFAPGAGITLGPAMTFGYVAGLHACGFLKTENHEIDISTT